MTTIRSIFKLHLLNLILLAMGGFASIGCGNKPGSEARGNIGESPNVRDSSDQRGRGEFEPARIFGVNDKIERFRFDDITGSFTWMEDVEIGNHKYIPQLRFKGTINLKNGTRYICRDDVCIIRLEDFVVTRGKIEEVLKN